ncbi:hypothetical protein ALQ34_200019 [Pseudomonas syringae pv. maculicola]|nr:hypothetical protein ALQ34_200019 [Pseudomonas syringae pv. maculicola]
MATLLKVEWAAQVRMVCLITGAEQFDTRMRAAQKRKLLSGLNS